MLNLTIDGGFIEEWGGQSSLKEQRFYEPDIFAYVREITGEIVLFGSQYADLRFKIQTNLCTSLTATIVDDCDGSMLFDGLLYVNDIKWNLTKCEARIAIVNNGFIGLINNNRSIKCTLNVDTSKNGFGLPTLPLASNVGFANNDSSISIDGRVGILMFDVLNRLVQFCSDGEISVVSDYFDYNYGDLNEPQKNLIIMTGNEVRLADQATWPTLSFEQVIIDLAATEQIRMADEVINGQKYIRIEPRGYFESRQTSSIFLNDVDEIEQETDETLFYSVIETGSNSPSETFVAMAETTFLSHNEQSFHLGGQCNLDSTLDLKTKTFVYDYNSLRRALPVSIDGSNDAEFDKDIFIIACFPHIPNMSFPALFYATWTLLPYSATDGYFNSRFSPWALMERWYNGIPSSVFSWLGGGGSGDVEAVNYGSQTFVDAFWPSTFQAIDFPSIITDISGNWNVGVIPLPVTYPYPVTYYETASGGLFSVNFSFTLSARADLISILVVDSAGVQQYVTTVYVILNEGPPINGVLPPSLVGIEVDGLEVVAGAVIPCAAGDRILVIAPSAAGVNANVANARITIHPTTTGELMPMDFRNTNFMLTTFSYPVPTGLRNQILANPYSRIEFSTSGYLGGGNLVRMERSLEDGMTEFEFSGSL